MKLVAPQSFCGSTRPSRRSRHKAWWKDRGDPLRRAASESCRRRALTGCGFQGARDLPLEVRTHGARQGPDGLDRRPGPGACSRRAGAQCSGISVRVGDTRSGPPCSARAVPKRSLAELGMANRGAPPEPRRSPQLGWPDPWGGSPAGRGVRDATNRLAGSGSTRPPEAARRWRRPRDPGHAEYSVEPRVPPRSCVCHHCGVPSAWTPSSGCASRSTRPGGDALVLL
jgi:hypothetical protein